MSVRPKPIVFSQPQGLIPGFWDSVLVAAPAVNPRQGAPETWGRMAAAAPSSVNGTITVATNPAGFASSLVGSTLNGILWAPLSSLDFIPTSRVTYLIVRRKTTTSLTVPSNFGIYGGGASFPGTAVDGNRAGGHMPWVDGNVYWDFGGSSGANRLTWSGYTPAINIESWAFIAGARGSAIYFNGLLVASQSTGITRTQGNLNLCVGYGGNGDLEGAADEISFFAALDAEWTPLQVFQWARDPWAVLVQPRDRKLTNKPAPPSANSGFFMLMGGL